MHDHDATHRGTTAQPFAPRLVRSDDPDDLPTHDANLHDPAVREIADSLADLFLGPSGETESSLSATAVRAPGRAPRAQSSRTTPTPSAPPLPVEMLVLGHLPVLAGAWLTQYATQAARALGRPVALARIEPGGLTIDVFGTEKHNAVLRHESPEAAIAAAASLVGGWLIRVDELAEATLAESPRVTAITLLSGVSESSIVAAYRTLKSIVQRAGSRAPLPDRDEPAELRIALLGATSDRVGEASARIRKAATTFLGRSVGVVVCAERIGITGMRSLYRGPYEGPAASLLELIGQAHAAAPASRGTIPGPAPRPTPTPASTHAPTEPRTPTPDGPRMLAEEDLTGPDTAAHSATSRADWAEEADWLLGPQDSHPAASPVTERSPTQTHETSGAARAATSSWAPTTAPTPHAARPFAAMLGLSTLPLRCPDAPRVEFAVDGAGHLHALVLDELSADAHDDPSSAPGRAGVAALLAADAWARANLSLIGRAMAFVRAGEIGLHLLTRIPAAARDLLGTRIRVHLLASAAAPGELCVALN